MRYKWFIAVGIMVLLCCCGRHEDVELDEAGAREIMDDVSRRNKAYEQLTAHDDTLMRQVVAYYDEHGTANERMEAYYLLGSVQRDLHDAPKAMKAFRDGIRSADTLSGDCRYDILARLYGQASDILRKEKLYKENARACMMAAKYAERAKDSLYAIDSYWHVLGAHFAYGDYETISNECWDLLEKSKRWNCYGSAIANLNTSILACIETGRIARAERLMQIYERDCGWGDSVTLRSSYPIYCYTKGRLLIALHKPDSAEFYFRRELEADDWNNRQAAYRGLREIFISKGIADSVSKYAVLQSEAVDSDYQTKLSQHLQTLNRLYDYSRAQEDIFRKDIQLEKIQRTHQRLWTVVLSSLFMLSLLLFTLYVRYLRRIAAAELAYERASSELLEKEDEIRMLYQKMESMDNEGQRQKLMQGIREAEAEAEIQWCVVEEKQKALDGLRKSASEASKKLRQKYCNEPIFIRLNEMRRRRKSADEDAYREVCALLQRHDSDIVQRVYSLVPSLSDTEFHTFLMLRIGLTKTEVAVLSSHAVSSISSIISRFFEKANGRKAANSAEAYKWLLEV